MAEIKNFVYSLNVDTVDGRTDIVGILNAMTPEYIPGLFSFSISFTLLGIAEGEHSFVVKFKDPEKEVIAGIDNAIVLYEKDRNSNLPDEQKGINIAAGLQNVNFKKSGLYSTEIVLDGTSMGEYYIFAKGKNE
ncbi:MAG: hypothetical protein NC433_04500 [Clostridiales bacterium]|nr:hypothetical protein [Clostridiales bacterium]